VWGPGELRALVVDDEPDVRLGLKLLADSLGVDTRTAGSAEEALEIAGRWAPHVVLSDITMGAKSGLDLLDELQRTRPGTRVVLITGFGTIEMAVSAMSRGASHFVTKPFDNEEILEAIRRFGAEALVNAQVEALEEAGRDDAAGRVIAEAPGSRAVFDLVAQVAPTDMTVLIQGESGVGKELVARAIHGQSPRHDRPFLAVNTAALPDSLLETELFGHRRGAFTGADRDRQGIFEQAAGGTVFLDEVGLMSPVFQGKLLRVLQERTVVPLGTAQAVPVDFRLVAATSRDLLERVGTEEFRQDLYYRLRVVTIDVPPLRDRTGDIPALAAHFLDKYARGVAALGGSRPILSGAALEALIRHPWPGNVRELENCVQRALVLCRSAEITPAHLGLEDPDTDASEGGDLTYEEGKRRAVAQFQRRYVERALAEAGGNVSQAARTCGLTRAALQRIMRSLGLDRSSFT